MGSRTLPPPSGVAYFDLDETLIAVKSMAAFLDFAAARIPGLPTWHAFLSSADPTWDRTRGNAEYYRLWAGIERDLVLDAGRAWVAAASTRPGFFIPSATRALRGHLDSGHEVVLVTGSFEPVVAPLAGRLGATDVLATKLAVRDGRYTGELIQPMIGDFKAHAVRAHREGAGVAAEKTWAYGDHPSDLPFLRAATHRYLVTEGRTLPDWAAQESELSPLPRDPSH